MGKQFVKILMRLFVGDNNIFKVMIYWYCMTFGENYVNKIHQSILDTIKTEGVIEGKKFYDANSELY